MRDCADTPINLAYWRFQADPTGIGASLGYAQAAYDDRRWREVRAPVDFETCHPALDTYEGAGWFRHRLTAPEAWSGRRIVLRLEGVNARAVVWVNGAEVGRCTDPFLPFEIEIQEALVPGDQNLIAVRVDNVRQQGEVPGMQRGWRNYGGLLREVTIRATDLCHLASVACVATPTETGGHLQVTATVQNDRPLDFDIALAAEVGDGTGQLLVTLPPVRRGLAAGASVASALTSDVPHALPWSPDQPNRYELRVTLLAGGEMVGSRTLKIGFRTIEARGPMLYLNGSPIFLTGFSRHEDSPDRNMCPDLALARRDFEMMKSAGANFVRLCHYPHHPAELDLCDEIGLLVMDEIPLYWWNGLEEGEAACAAKLATARRQLERIIRRDGNHPSVVFWSVSNETQENRPEVEAGNVALLKLAKALDSTRLAVHVSDHWQHLPNSGGPDGSAVRDGPRLFEHDDVICVNGYPGAAAFIYPDANITPGNYDLAAATAFWRQRLSGLNACYPDKPVLVTEFGSVSFYQVADGPFGGDLHAEVIAHEFAGMDAPYVCGATIWCWADHAWPPGTFAFCNHLATSPYGVLTRDRRRKPAFWTARRLFRMKQGLALRDSRGPATGPSGREIFMVRPNLRDIPEVALPDGYDIRTLRPDEGGLWTDIWREADPWMQLGPEMFVDQFGDDLPALGWRGFIVQDARGVAVATITAWYNRAYKGEDYGQVHWVATRQSHWGRGIGKAMMSHALRQMARWHDRAFLGTQTKRIPAIKLYLDFGFVPDLDHEGAREAWREVKAALEHPALQAIDLG